MSFFDKSNTDQVSETFCGFEPLGKQAQLPDVAQVSEIMERTRPNLCEKTASGYPLPKEEHITEQCRRCIRAFTAIMFCTTYIPEGSKYYSIFPFSVRLRRALPGF